MSCIRIVRENDLIVYLYEFVGCFLLGLRVVSNRLSRLSISSPFSLMCFFFGFSCLSLGRLTLIISRFCFFSEFRASILARRIYILTSSIDLCRQRGVLSIEKRNSSPPLDPHSFIFIHSLIRLIDKRHMFFVSTSID